MTALIPSQNSNPRHDVDRRMLNFKRNRRSDVRPDDESEVWLKGNRPLQHWLLCPLVVLFLLTAGPFVPTAHGQADGLDSYDPFADYSEFEENSQEEADIHFFRNGRFFNVGFLLGAQFFTESYGTFVDPAIAPGFFFVYFFNLRFAAQLEYNNANHRLEIPANPNNPSAEVLGTITHGTIALHFKIYLNTQNITRGLANLNPYLIVGPAQIYRTFRVSSASQVGKDNSTALDMGGGIEIPIMKNRMYIGAQAYYRLASFPAEDVIIQDEFLQPTGVSLKGDEIDVQFVLGVNFQ